MHSLDDYPLERTDQFSISMRSKVNPRWPHPLNLAQHRLRGGRTSLTFVHNYDPLIDIPLLIVWCNVNDNVVVRMCTAVQQLCQLDFVELPMPERWIECRALLQQSENCPRHRHIVVRSPRLQGMRSAVTNAYQSGTSNYFIFHFLSKRCMRA